MQIMEFSNLRSQICQKTFTRHHLMTSDMDDSRKYRLKAYPLLSVSDAVPATATQLEYPLIYERDQILGSCNGIVCVANRQGGFAVFWNPSTRRFKKSPPLENPRIPGSYAAYGFGYDHFADSYNVVAVFWYEYKMRVKVHTLGTNCWRMIQDFPSFCVPQSAVFVSGKLNWLALASESVANLQRVRWVIISQDLGKECYQELLLPGDYEDDGGKQATNLQVLKDCLCVYILSPRRRICDIWLMMEYGRKESWTKLFTVPDPNICFSGTKILHISKEDEGLVVKEHGILYLYNFRDNTFKILPIRNIEDWTVPVVYVESLISPCF
ncbi:F-box/kelch-repeat protein At3g23880-like [Lotus japonicus]|uniref:F-box/kelch-repeat protein At3g23880-like n=1 Tax=Lotus japonicus TaxID=34305 RepID=UPI00258FD029|nr:F-box/kelch-repeat protein At3g23880-like [Lotus japonicus]